MTSLRDIVRQVPPKRLMPAATPDQLREVAERLGRPLPQPLVDALGITAGFDFEYPLSLLGKVGGQDLSPICPHTLPFWEDGFGNSWGLDCDVPPGDDCRVLFACHDPPVVMFAAGTIADFLEFVISVQQSEDDQDHERHLMALSGGAGSIVENGQPRRLRKSEKAIVDMTNAKPGDGFWWAGQNAHFVARRVANGPIFEVWRE